MIVQEISACQRRIEDSASDTAEEDRTKCLQSLTHEPFLRRHIQRCEKLIESYKQDIVRIEAEAQREIGKLVLKL